MYEDVNMTPASSETRDVDRFIFFSDAVFAIAMTLLVVDVRLPETGDPTDPALLKILTSLIPAMIGFVISFLVISRFWIAHHNLMRFVSSANGQIITINLLLLMAVAFMPFPSAVLGTYPKLRLAVGHYTVWLLVIAFANIWLIRTVCALENLPREQESAIRRTMWAPVIIAIAGFIAGMIMPMAGPAALTIATPPTLFFLSRKNRGV